MKKMIIMVILFILIAACQQEAPKKTEEFNGTREVKVSVAQRGEFSKTLHFSGRIIADEVINIKPSLGGEVVQMIVREGDFVRKGDLLAKLDDTNLKQAQLQFDAIARNYERLQELLKADAIDTASFEEMETAYLQSKNNLDFIRKNTEITAPIDGIISALYKKQNDNFDSMMDPYLLRIVNLSNIKAEFQVSETDVNNLKTGSRVIISVDNSDREFEGKIFFISPEADPLNGKFKVQAALKNIGGDLKHNQFVRISAIIASSENSISIPQQAVIDNDHVFIVKDGRAKKQMVILGLTTEYETEIISGIDDTAQVIIMGNIGLNDGEPVLIVD